jgi:serine/threonine-protein kinase RIO1
LTRHSAFNILYWQGQITVIDFPQAVDPRFNGTARMLLERDVANVCSYFRRYGLRVDATRIADALWEKYLCGGLPPLYAGSEARVPRFPLEHVTHDSPPRTPRRLGEGG